MDLDVRTSPPRAPARRHALTSRLPVALLVACAAACSGPHDPGEDAGAPPPALTAPADLTATVTSSSAVVLSWTAAEGEAGLRVERGPFGGELALLASVPQGTTAFTDDTAAPEGHYAYRVVAFDAAGEEAASEVIEVELAPAAPSALRYSTDPAVYTKGVAIPDNTPSSGGGAVASYSISPALPEGLSLDPVSGVIAGTPAELAASTVYTVTAVNSGGSATATVTITVNDAPPSALAYSEPAAAYTRGVAIPDNTPSSSGGAVVSYSIAPALPPGLTIDPTTGILSGTPAELAASTVYTVTAVNSGGSATATVTITVNDAPPSALAYSEPAAVYTRGVAIPDNTPSSSGGAVVSYSIAPALPPGLTIDPTTGILSGTPAELAASTVYTVTAVNSGGSATATLTITVNDAPPSALAYSSPAPVYTRGVAIPDNTPSSSGGAVVSYSVAPALPPGLTIDPTSGILSGTPAELAASADYTVTAVNSGGSATATLTITVNDAPPSALAYSSPAPVYTRGVAIPDNTPSSSGGAVISYSVAPPLPPGLTIDPTSGVLSGTPSVIAPLASYTVTATNSGGSATATLAITVEEVAPFALGYASSTAVYTASVPITPNTPSSSGSPVTSYSVEPALPAGLTLDPVSGIIDGTPALMTPRADYTITASNAQGSTTAVVTITVTDRPPAALAYSSNPAIYTRGLTIADNTPSSGGGAVSSYAISPPLPAGLSLDPASGVITGTPTALAPRADYVVTATNDGGSTTATISITVNATPTLVGTVLSGPRGVAGASVVMYALAPGAAAEQIGEATTDAGGNFSMSFGDPSRAGAGDLVYVVASGGAPDGAATNAAAAWMTVPGAYCVAETPGCAFPASVALNEITTVASTAALQRFLRFADCAAVAGNTRPAGDLCAVVSGDDHLAGAARSVGSLADLATGQPSAFLTANAARSAAIALTLGKLGSLASVLEACASSDGTSAACGGLFDLTVHATDTLRAAFELAAYPAMNRDGAGLHALIPAAPVWTPLAAAPADLTVAGQRFGYVTNSGDHTVSAYRLPAANDHPSPLAGSPFSTGGSSPREAVIDPRGRFLFVVAGGDASAGPSVVIAYVVDPATGVLTEASGSPLSIAERPTAAAISPDGRFLFTVSEGGGAVGNSVISAFTVDGATGALTHAGDRDMSSGAVGPTGVAVHPSGRFVYATASTGDVFVYSVDARTGALAFVQDIVAGASASAIALDPSGRHAYVANAGDDNLSIFAVDAGTGLLSRVVASACGTTPELGNCVAAGGDPQAITLSADGGYAYVVNADDRRVQSFRRDAATGLLSSLGPTFAEVGGGPVAVAVDEGGALGYVVDRAGDALAVFAIGGRMTLPTSVPGGPYDLGSSGGDWVGVDPTGRFVYAGGTDLTQLAIDPVTGALSAVAGSPFAGSQPLQYGALDPTGRFALFANERAAGSDTSVLALDPGTGAPTEISGSPFPHGLPTFSVAVDPFARFVYVATWASDPGLIPAWTLDSTSGALTPITTGGARSCEGSPTDPMNCFSVSAGILTSIAVDPSGRFVYATSSLGSVLALAIDDWTGAITEIAGSPYAVGGAPWGIAVHPSGRFVYVVNPDLDAVMAFAADADPSTGTGALTPITTGGAASCGTAPDLASCVATGDAPQAVAVSPDGRFAYVGNGDGTISAYAIDGATGSLTAIGPAVSSGSTWVRSVAVDPTGRFLYAGNTGGADVSAFTIDPSTGALAVVPGIGAVVAAGAAPTSWAMTP